MLTMTTAPKKQIGFTVIELLMSLVILAVLLMIGLPSFRQFIQKNQIKASAEAIQNGIQLARAEAVRTNSNARFTLATGTGASSWTVADDSTGTTVQQSRASGEGGSAEVVTTTYSGNPLAADTSALRVTFNGFGRVVANTPSSIPILAAVDVGIAGGPANSTLRIEVQNPGGQVRICDPSVSTAGTDTRRCLQ